MEYDETEARRHSLCSIKKLQETKAYDQMLHFSPPILIQSVTKSNWRTGRKDNFSDSDPFVGKITLN